MGLPLRCCATVPLRSTGVAALILFLAGGVSPRGLGAQEAAPDAWDIGESRAPSTTRVEFTAREGTWMSVDVSPDGLTIAFDLLGHIYEMPLEGGVATPLTSGRSWNMFPRYAPDGGHIALTSDRSGSEDLWILDRATGALENVSDTPTPVVQASWSADGDALYGTALEQDASSTGYRFGLDGGRQEITGGQTFQTLAHFEEDTGRGVLFFEHVDEALPTSGSRIKTYDLQTGEVQVRVQRPGGAFNPALSPDGAHLVYGHRDDLETVLILQNLDTREERVLVRGLDRDHQEYGPYYYGMAPNIAWTPDGSEVVLARNGVITAVDVASGAVREIPFEAPVDREIDETIRFEFDFPEGQTRALSYRFPIRTEAGVVFEALGDIWMKTGSEAPVNLTNSAAHETSPLVDADRGRIYHATWTDDDLGSLHWRPLGGGSATQVTSVPSQYSSLALSDDGAIAFVRGTGALVTGARLEEQTDFELVVVAEGRETQVVEVSGTPNTQGHAPFTVRFSPDGDWIYYTEFVSDTLTLRRVGRDGTRKATLARFPHGEQAVLSPDLSWIAFREYHANHVTPLAWIGKPMTISAYDGLGATWRVDDSDGAYLNWSDAETVSWTRGGWLHEKAVSTIVDTGDATPSDSTDLGITYTVDGPGSVVALTDVRVVTMDEERSVLEGATILIRDNRIVEVGVDVEVPAEAREFDLDGHTVIPGLVDAHAHPDAPLSITHTVEQRLAGISASLAYGVTTLYELYGTEEKDPWVRDMVQSGRMDGPRLLTVGAPMYGLREFRPRTYRPVDSYADALRHARYSRAQGVTALKDYVNFARADRHQLMTAARETGLNIVAETAGDAPMNFTQVVDGVTGLEHSMGVTPLYDDVVQFLAASEVGITPTLLVVYNGPSGQAFFDQSRRVWEDEKLLRFSREDDLRAFRRVTHYWEDDLYAPEMAAAMKRLHDAGVLINAGGHGQMLGLDMHWEMELLAQGGFDPMEVLQVATRNGAVYYGLDEEIGSIEVGKRADLVVLASNPLDDIRNTRDIVWVLRDGVVYDGEDGARVYPAPAPAAEFYFQRGVGR